MPFLPQQASNSCIRRAKKFIRLSNKKNIPVKGMRNDLRRMALVMAVAGLDTYIHGIIIRRLSKVRSEGELPNVLKKLDIPFLELASLADATIYGQREKKSTRPWVQVKNAIHRRLFEETFQSYEQIGKGFALAGIKKGWSKVAKEISDETYEIKSRLNSLVYRRNQIAHEGDMKRSSRPQSLKFNSIDRKKIRQDVNWIENLLSGIDKVINKES